MRKIFFIVAVFFLACTFWSKALAQDIQKKDYSNFQTIIQGFGYSCNSCEGGHVLGQGSRGINFRVYCNDNELKYFVTVGNEGRTICVEPWNRKGTKCEE